MRVIANVDSDLDGGYMIDIEIDGNGGCTVHIPVFAAPNQRVLAKYKDEIVRRLTANPRVEEVS